MSTVHVFLVGLGTMGFLTASLFFLRFWRETRDRLFVLFSVAFLLLALNRGLAAVVPATTHEMQPYFYLVRLAAFVLIAWAVIDKNRRGS